MKEFENAIFEIIRNCTSVLYEDGEITRATNLTEDLDFDSITLMQLIIEIEETFNIRFEDDVEFDSINNVGKLIDIARSKTEKDK